ncbi:MAG: hypothetical protein GC203_00535 [Phenylobacterium sp.]|uniref:DUF6644 family protein n=1 Tax=Phenylobacterium sp. TaxID=1871053 RepID=UPI0025CC307A|nr:DUF6644 family protein [Phenylobacterium sp.]MBI1196329.1 hypothetical protein [Phenylobacterium sp.]
MTIAPQDFFPHLADWVANLDDVFPGKQIKPWFAQWEVGHIVSLILLGGSSILLNLRLIGVGLTEESPAEVRRNVGPWVHVGVVGVVLTGLLIGSANAERLYTSEAFSAKMVGLLAGVILTYGVSLPLAKADGRASAGMRIAGVLGLAIFALAVCMFFSAKLANPGLWHVLTAGGLIVLYATRGRIRWIYLGVMLALIAAQQVMTHIVVKADDYEHLDPVNKTFAFVFLGVIAAGAAAQIVASNRGQGGSAFAKGMAYAGILVWVMTAAAGRWLAFA